MMMIIIISAHNFLVSQNTKYPSNCIICKSGSTKRLTVAPVAIDEIFQASFSLGGNSSSYNEYKTYYEWAWRVWKNRAEMVK
jgi:hypothetical protein